MKWQRPVLAASPAIPTLQQPTDLQDKIQQRALNNSGNINIRVNGDALMTELPDGDKNRLYCTLTVSQGAAQNARVPVAGYLTFSGQKEPYWHGCRDQPYSLQEGNWQISSDGERETGKLTVTLGFDFNDPMMLKTVDPVSEWNGEAYGKGSITIEPILP
ncbi:MAG: hypothetical protein ACRC5A_03200 [Enterobacteriaceae bacterium]